MHVSGQKRSRFQGIYYQRPQPCLEQLPTTHIARKRMKRAPTQQPVRRLSCLQRGRLVLLAALSVGRLVPEPWPETITPPKKEPKPSKRRQQQKRRERKKRHKAAQRRKTAA